MLHLGDGDNITEYHTIILIYTTTPQPRYVCSDMKTSISESEVKLYE